MCEHVVAKHLMVVDIAECLLFISLPFSPNIMIIFIQLSILSI